MNSVGEWQMVHVRKYSEPRNLLGKDLISMLSRTKGEVAALVGDIADKSTMTTEELPGECVTSMTGEIADEIHEWPNATLGPEFRHLTLQFREGRLIGLRWGFQKTASTPGKPWWKFW